MHEDPTRRMDAPPPPPPDRPPPGEGMSSGLKAVIGILVAAVLGLGIALALVAADGGDESPASTVTSVPTTLPTTTTAPPPTATTTVPTTTTAPPTTTTATETVTETGGGPESP